MNRIKEQSLKNSLTTAIQNWIENGDGMPLDLGCYVGEDLAEIMASAAFAVLRGIVDAQEYLTQNDMLRD